MCYNEGGIGNNGQGIVVPTTPKMKSPRTCLGYDASFSSLPTLCLATTMEVLFVVAGGVYSIGCLEELLIFDSVE
jgi:hypothetical protein